MSTIGPVTPRTLPQPSSILPASISSSPLSDLAASTFSSLTKPRTILFSCPIVTDLYLLSPTIKKCWGEFSKWLTFKKLERDLDLWSNEKKDTPEYQARITAQQRILDCFWQHSNSLDLTNLRLTSLPPSICILSQLTTLDLFYNKLQSLPSEFGNLSQLTTLDLSYNKLQSLPPEFGNLSLLTSLDLSYNKLQSLPPEFGNLSLLTSLVLSDNQLQSIPSEIGNLSLLTTLYLFDNQLQSLPPEIGNLTQLTSLALYSNQFQSVPPEIGNLSLLTRLDLSYNQFQSLPPELAQLSARCNINAENNRFSLETMQTFQQLATQQRLQNPLLGPQVSFSIQEAPVQENCSTLQQAITFWTKQFQAKFPEGNTLWEDCHEGLYSSPSFFQPLLEHSDTASLCLFLDKLQRTKDFTTPTTQANFVWRVNLVLRDACINNSFQEKFFWLVKESLSTCNDRPTIYLGQIELQRLLLCDAPQQDLSACANLVIGAERLSLLEKKVGEILQTKQFRDDIEALLYCQIQLKKILALPISIEGMLYAGVAGITDEELEELASSIQAETSQSEDQIQILIASDIWQEKIEKEYREFADLQDEATGKLSDIPIDNNADYLLQSDRLMTALEDQKKALALTKTQEWMSSKP